jgi:DNA repair protein RecO (recombination protein O)
LIHQTRGVVLNHVKYAETSVIVHVYTEMFGRQSYMMNNVRSAKNKGKSIFLQPLALLELQVYHSPKKQVQLIKDFKIAKAFSSIPFDQTKRSVAFFVTEVLNRSLLEEEANPELFDFIFDAVQQLDEPIDNAHLFHLSFTAQLTRFLGFYPHFSIEEPYAFDLRNGETVSAPPIHNHLIGNDLLPFWIALFEENNTALAKLASATRNQLADYLLEYYALHLEGFGHIRSFDILKDLYA